jgi:DNA-binding CsgD family transcriptional regulator
MSIHDFRSRSPSGSRDETAAGKNPAHRATVVALPMPRRPHSGHDGMSRLTARQREVLALMAEGRSNASIGRALALTEHAVVQHVSNIYAQLGLLPSDDDHRRVLAVIRYLSR